MADNVLDFTTKYARDIEERFRRASLTDAAAGKDYDFTGARSVKLYTMTPANLVDYERGGKRFGDVTDLEYTTQEMLCTQAKAFTKHLEALDSSDISIGAAAGKFLRMEIEEVITPMMDKYRLNAWVKGSGTRKTMSAAPTKSTIVGDIMELKGDMADNGVPGANLALFIENRYYLMLKQADAIDHLEGVGTKALEKGVVAMFDGMKVVPVPSGWLPEGAYFMIKAAGTSADPVKLAQYKTINNAVGYSGPVVQGLVYFDSFVVAVKAAGVGVAGTAALMTKLSAAETAETPAAGGKS